MGHLYSLCPLRPANGDSFPLSLVPGYLIIFAGSLNLALITVNTPFTKTSSTEQLWVENSLSYQDPGSYEKFFFKKESYELHNSLCLPSPHLMLAITLSHFWRMMRSDRCIYLKERKVYRNKRFPFFYFFHNFFSYLLNCSWFIILC